ncbi:glycosyltransferase, partial [Francisella tularensis subsp. holarctica]|nr:glycosyltransferase [Francisella tularensis subsp. holarctica]
IVVSIMFFSGVQLIYLGVLFEYIIRIFDEAKKRPRYIIDEYESRNI